ncbi:Rieske (2Fe-2S) protein [Amphritea balenae]|uniref:Ferredoxin n=1 Tax=Amphritea balenae TaxID=452629 RepID=A0A3P1SXC1_9GAMM|nr:Rieske 2Fe-2S domain-containing protein [Amphritea balenae]RRD01790.1 ferredoxin [Amphritea balenae]GGK53984.1 benzene 1,2-dioxygenase [Amphritea balenae]
MAHWHDVATALESGEHRVIELNEFSVLLVNIDGCYYAVENICPHDGGELDGGTFSSTTGNIPGSSTNISHGNSTNDTANDTADNPTVTCPRHGACFNLKTGKVLKPPAFEDIDCFAVRIQDGRLQIYDEPTEQNDPDL